MIQLPTVNLKQLQNDNDDGKIDRKLCGCSADCTCAGCDDCNADNEKQ